MLRLVMHGHQSVHMSPIAARALWISHYKDTASASCYGLPATLTGPSKRQSAHRICALVSPRCAAAAAYTLSGLSAAEDASKPLKLIIYSRDNCTLCEVLKEKVQAVLDRAQFSQSLLSAAILEVRDISSSAEWEAMYSLRIPVLAAADPDGSHERMIPRPAPRLTADRLEKHIINALT